jgi:acetyl-CoA carboxylase carboxyl transferase subunit alpha
MRTYLDFEKPVADLQGKVQELRSLGANGGAIAVEEEIGRMEARASQALTEIYSKLTPWQKTQVARHPDRPHVYDYVKTLIDEFTPLAGDRKFGEDQAMVAGLGRFRGRPVAILGQEKGSDTESRLRHNFGMPRPEGYRKAVRIMELANRFSLPLIALVDTSGAYPGIGAEERGISQAIAYNLREMMRISTPMIVVITGEGCSGGAIGIGVGDVVLILQHAYYSVITPEGCAAILWRDASQMAKAAATMKLTSEDLLKHHIVDEILPEPLGGCHYDAERMAATLKERLLVQLDRLSIVKPDDLLERRYQRFRELGVFSEKVIKLKAEEKPAPDEHVEDDGASAISSSEA